MYKQNGFTLIELLIAATIIGVLVIFATQSFRKTSSQIRVEDAKARAQVVAMAVRRFKIDYPSASVGENPDPLGYVTGPSGTCNHSTITLQNLVNCNYLDYRQYATELYVDGKHRSYFVMTFSGSDPVQVCVKRQDNQGKILDTDTYCTDGETWFK